MHTPSSRPDNAASIVGGLLGGLVVAGSVIAFFTLNDPRTPDESISELRIAVAELKAQTSELRAQIASQPAPAQPPMIFHAPPPPPPEPPPPPRAAPPPPGAIDCPGEHHCTLDRAYLDELLANPASLARQARIMPSMHDGQFRGFKMYGIRPGSLPNLLGFRNGDMIVGINGQPLTRVEDALNIYPNLRTPSSVALEVERKGEMFTKTCDIR
jgi:hypothetical protein